MIDGRAVLSLSLTLHAGLVTTMVTPEQVDRLQEIAGELELSITEQAEPPLDIEIELEGDMETAKKGLDDLYNLL